MDELERQIRAWADAAAPDASEAVSAEEILDRPAVLLATPHGRPRRPRQLTVALAAAVVVAIVGLAVALRPRDQAPVRTDADPAGHRIAVDPEALHGPGSPLIGELTVLPGSFLIGDILPVLDLMPSEGSTAAPTGWMGLLLVDGDPLLVWDAYRAAIGIEGTAADACLVSVESLPSASATDAERPDLGTIPARFLTEEPLEGENTLRCLAAHDGVALQLTINAPTCATVAAEERQRCQQSAASMLSVFTGGSEDEDDHRTGTLNERLRRSVTSVEPGDEPLNLDEYPIPTGPVQPPTFSLGPVPGHLPLPGESSVNDLDPLLADQAIGLLPPEGRSLVAPSLLGEYCGGMALFTVPGSAEAAVRWFDDAAEDDEPAQVVTGVADGRAFAGAVVIKPDGYRVDVTAIETVDGRAQVFFGQCGV